jgi:hypothetical protein
LRLQFRELFAPGHFHHDRDAKGHDVEKAADQQAD